MPPKPIDLEAEERTTAVGLARLAFDFYEAGVLVVGPQPRLVPPAPALYLLGHSVELILKAFLRHRGDTLPQLLKIGHSLVAAHQRAATLGLHDVVAPTALQVEALAVLSDVYAAKQLEYVTTGFTRWPRYELVDDLAANLLQAVGLHVGYSRRLAGPT